MKFNPYNDIVVIKVDPPKERTSSGLYIAEEWKTLPPVGEVVAVGPEVKEVRVGQRVLFNRYASIILEDNVRICNERHCHASIEESADVE